MSEEKLLFSFADDSKRILSVEDTFRFLVPEQFSKEFRSRYVKNIYVGYGVLAMDPKNVYKGRESEEENFLFDMMELVALWNKEFLTASYCERYSKMNDIISTKMQIDSERSENIRRQLEIRMSNLMEEYDKLRVDSGYKIDELDAIDFYEGGSFYSVRKETVLIRKYGKMILEDSPINEHLTFPLKIVSSDYGLSYEQCSGRSFLVN